MEAKREPLFRFDHFFKSRTVADIKNRFSSLLNILKKEDKLE